MALLDKLGVPKGVLACKNFDEVLAKGYFANLSQEQMIAVYDHFTLNEEERSKAIPYQDFELPENIESLDESGFHNRDISISVEGADTTISELISEGYKVRRCGEKGKMRGLAAWMDEGDWQYLGLIYVSPEFRRSGIMCGLIEDCADGRPITTKVHSGNLPALKAFKKYGFCQERTNGDYVELLRR